MALCQLPVFVCPAMLSLCHGRRGYSPPRQHIVLGVAALEVLRLLLAIERFRQLLDALDHVVGEILGRNLLLGFKLALAVEPLDHRIGEEAVPELGVSMAFWSKRAAV